MMNFAVRKIKYIKILLYQKKNIKQKFLTIDLFETSLMFFYLYKISFQFENKN